MKNETQFMPSLHCKTEIRYVVYSNCRFKKALLKLDQRCHSLLPHCFIQRSETNWWWVWLKLWWRCCCCLLVLFHSFYYDLLFFLLLYFVQKLLLQPQDLILHLVQPSTLTHKICSKSSCTMVILSVLFPWESFTTTLSSWKTLAPIDSFTVS